MPPQIGHRRERRSQDKRSRRMLGCKVHRHRCSERFAEVHEPRRVDVGPAGQVRARGAAVQSEPLLRWSPRISAVTPIINEQNLQSLFMERRRQGGTVRPVAGVPVENQNGDTRRRPRCGQEPAAQFDPVGRLESHRLDPVEIDFGRGQDGIRREVHQSALRRPDECQDGSNDGNIPGPSHRWVRTISGRAAA